MKTREELIEMIREMMDADVGHGCGFYDSDEWNSAYHALAEEAGGWEGKRE